MKHCKLLPTLAAISLMFAATPEALAQDVSITEVMDAAAQQTERAELIELAVERSQSQRSQRLGELLPVASLSATLTRNQQEVAIGDSVVVNLWDYSAQTLVSVDLFRGGTIPDYLAAGSDAEAQALLAESSTGDLRLAAGRAYIAALTARKNVQASEDDLALRQATLEQIQALLDAGYGIEADVSQARLAVTDAETARIQNQIQLEDALDQLILLTGMQLQADQLTDPGLEMSSGRAQLEERSDFLALERSIESSESRELARWFDLLPTLTLTGRYEFGRPSFRAPDGAQWTLSLTATWILFDWTTWARVDEAELVTRELQVERQIQLDEAEVERRSALRTIAGAEAVVELSEEAVVSAQEVRNVVSVRYAEGDATVLELTEADATVFSAQIRLNLAILERDLELLELAWLEGELDD